MPANLRLKGRFVNSVLRRQGRNREAVLGTAEAMAFRYVDPSLYLYAPFFQFALFGVTPQGVFPGGGVPNRMPNISRLGRAQAARPVPVSGAARTVVLVPVNGELPQVDLDAMRLSVGSRLVILTKDLRSFDEYSTVRISGVQIRRVKLQDPISEIPTVSELQKIFAQRADTLPVLIFPSSFDPLELYKKAADREGLVVRMARLPSARLALSDLVGRFEPAELVGKLPREVFNLTVVPGALYPISVPRDSENHFVEEYLAEITQAKFVETAA